MSPSPESTRGLSSGLRGAPSAPSAPNPDFKIETAGSTLALSGDWTLPHLTPLIERATAAPLAESGYSVDARALTGLDTAGALLLVRTLSRTGREWRDHRLEGVRPEHQE